MLFASEEAKVCVRACVRAKRLVEVVLVDELRTGRRGEGRSFVDALWNCGAAVRVLMTCACSRSGCSEHRALGVSADGLEFLIRRLRLGEACLWQNHGVERLWRKFIN